MKFKNIIKNRKKIKRISEFNSESNPLNVEQLPSSTTKKGIKICFQIKDKYVLLLIIFITASVLINIYTFYLIFTKNTQIKILENSPNQKINLNSQEEHSYNKPFLPLNKEEIIVKEYHKTKYDSSKLRFHFEDLFLNRTLFKINYNYLPYTEIKKSLSYEENAKIIYESTGMLNMTLLDYYYFNNVTDRSNFNHIHLSMGMDAKYVLLSMISMTSILNNSSPDTFIHFHVLFVNCTFEDIQRMYKLKYINQNVEFIFYNAKQAEYDFSRGLKEFRGIGDYTRVLIPEIVNNTNRIIIFDSGDVFANKDLSELYYFDIGDNYFVFSLEDIAGTFDRYTIFGRNNFYPNTGICLVNVRKFREDNLYEKAFYTSIAYAELHCPYQDIFLVISHFKFKYWPLNYNCPQFFDNDEQLKQRKNDTRWIKNFMKLQNNSPFKYTVDEIFDAASDPVINHLYHSKPYNNQANKKFMDLFREYSKMTGVLEEIKKIYPQCFKGL